MVNYHIQCGLCSVRRTYMNLLDFIVYYHNISKYMFAEDLWFQYILSINHSFVYCRHNNKLSEIDTEEKKTKRSQ
jgi:hypothetical protein